MPAGAWRSGRDEEEWQVEGGRARQVYYNIHIISNAIIAEAYTLKPHHLPPGQAISGGGPHQLSFNLCLTSPIQVSIFDVLASYEYAALDLAGYYRAKWKTLTSISHLVHLADRWEMTWEPKQLLVDLSGRCKSDNWGGGGGGGGSSVKGEATI